LRALSRPRRAPERAVQGQAQTVGQRQRLPPAVCAGARGPAAHPGGAQGVDEGGRLLVQLGEEGLG
jgi:hypothetical protein